MHLQKMHNTNIQLRNAKAECFENSRYEKADLGVDEVLVPPDGYRHHGVAVGHDQHGGDVLRGQHPHVVH